MLMNDLKCASRRDCELAEYDVGNGMQNGKYRNQALI